jgi:hypothetical protein
MQHQRAALGDLAELIEQVAERDVRHAGQMPRLPLRKPTHIHHRHLAPVAARREFLGRQRDGAAVASTGPSPFRDRVRPEPPRRAIEPDERQVAERLVEARR